MIHPSEALPWDNEKARSCSPTLKAQSTCRSTFRRLLRTLLPSFLLRKTVSSQEVARTTDFLDGMRGYAAFGVFICHFFIPTHPKAHVAYGGNNGVDDYWLTQLPIVRLVYHGKMDVYLFFVISGFSISLKPLKLARNGSYSALLDSIASATFRRAFRLYLPCIATLVITFLLVCCGAFDFRTALQKDWPFLSAPRRTPKIYATFSKQLAHFATELWEWSDPLSGQAMRNHYAIQFWTIPIELACSFVTFVTIIGLAKLSARPRMSFVGLIAVYFQCQNHTEATLFLVGAVLAELHLIQQDRFSSTTGRGLESRAQKTKSFALFFLGLYLGSWPYHGAATSLFWSPFNYIASFVVTDAGDNMLCLFCAIAGALLVHAVARSPSLQVMFTTPLARYLGKTSFALYCVHQLLINCIGYQSILFFWSLTGNDTIWSYELGNGLAFLFIVIPTIWVADVFWRLIDMPTVEFTKWLEKQCFTSS